MVMEGKKAGCGMEIIEALKKALERGFFTFEDTDAFGVPVQLAKADWGSEIIGGYQRLEMEVADDKGFELKSQAQDLGFWVDYVSPPGMKTCLRFTIPPED